MKFIYYLYYFLSRFSLLSLILVMSYFGGFFSEGLLTLKFIIVHLLVIAFLAYEIISLKKRLKIHSDIKNLVQNVRIIFFLTVSDKAMQDNPISDRAIIFVSIFNISIIIFYIFYMS